MKITVRPSTARHVIPLMFLFLGPVSRGWAFEAEFLFRFGGSGSADGQFNLPIDAAIDRARGRIYVTDFTGNDIQIFDLDGNFLGKFGSSGSGDGQFISPAGIDVQESTGVVYVAEYGNHRVQYFTPTANNLTFAGKWGSSGTADGLFGFPAGLSIDQTTGNVYVGEFNGDRVQYFDSSGGFLGKWAGVNDVSSVAVNGGAGLVYVTEYNNSRFSIFTLNGTPVDVINEITPMRNFSQPAGVTITQGGLVIVTDRTAPVPIFEGDGTVSPYEFASNGTGPGQLTAPYGIDSDETTGLTVITEGNSFVSVWRVRRFNQAPTVAIRGAKRIRTTKPKIALRGTAADADGAIARVEVKAGPGGYRPAKGLGRWTYRAKLRAGNNRIRIRAVDDDGARSKIAKMTVAREVLAPKP